MDDTLPSLTMDDTLPSLTIDKFKDEIVRGYPNSFNNTDGKDLALIFLHTFIPRGRGVKDREITADDFEKKEPMTGGILSDYFSDSGAPANHIHIIIEKKGKKRSLSIAYDDDVGVGSSNVKRPKTLKSLLKDSKLNIPVMTHEHEFYDRSNFTRAVVPIVTSNCNRRGQSDQKSHTAILIPGGS
ncbi:hypothetical protein BGZ76_002727 [Entomortierella beljakovae]|nr:hypothetical protein BGZ76_002727 [Entomortierella beljakovae]